MNRIQKIILPFLSLLLFSLNISAQDMNPSKIEMADILHQNGKIYLVVLVLLTIFAGILFLLISMERKLARLEKNNILKK